MRRWLVVLVSPKEAGNVGAAARVIRNFGAGGLRVVAPRCEVAGHDARRFSSGAADVLRRAEVYPSLGEALSDREVSIALTGVGGRHHRMDCVGLMPRALLEGRDHLRRGALIYGPEDTGLTGQDMEVPDLLWSLPTNPAFPSLNLAQAIAVSLAAVAEVERERGLAELGLGIAPSASTLNPLADSPDPDDQPATNRELQELMGRFEALLRETGWPEGKGLSTSVGKIRNVLTRAVLTRREANLLHGVTRNALHRVLGRKGGKGG